MLVDGNALRTIWTERDSVVIIDQTELPHCFATKTLTSIEAVAHAIRSMQVRGAPLIGIAAAYGLALGLRASPDDYEAHHMMLCETRPTAVNLRWAVEQAWDKIKALPSTERAHAAWLVAGQMADADVAACQALAEHGLSVFPSKKRVNVLTHCNAGWLATIDWGTALAPIYLAQQKGIDVHVYVDETRPRNQGASLTAWELGKAGISHTVIVDNAGGLLMMQKKVDLCIVGTDRTTRTGDVCNKIGTYLKALAAKDNEVPFYVALPTSSYDAKITEIPIEERSEDEVHFMSGTDADGTVRKIRVTPVGSRARNPGFDITPAKLVTAFITERGVLRPEELATRL